MAITLRRKEQSRDKRGADDKEEAHTQHRINIIHCVKTFHELKLIFCQGVLLKICQLCVSHESPNKATLDHSSRGKRNRVE